MPHSIAADVVMRKCVSVQSFMLWGCSAHMRSACAHMSYPISVRQVNPAQRISACGDEDFGMMAHLNVEGGRKFSSGVIPLVRDITGWPIVAGEEVPQTLQMGRAVQSADATAVLQP